MKPIIELGSTLSKTNIPNKINAITRLVNGPTRAINATLHSPFLSLFKLKGTGLAPPKIG